MLCRLLPFAIADGAANMAADEAMLESAVAGVASLRFYEWSEPTVSLGYFQQASLIDTDVRLASLPLVRRPSGGETLIHHHELTYALALPAGPPWQSKEPWQCRMHRVITAALKSMSVADARCAGDAKGEEHPFLCFVHPIPGDVLVGRQKVVGSAQRRRRGALLQHGAILLSASPHAPQLPGIKELAGVTLSTCELAGILREELGRETGWTIQDNDWTDAERQQVAHLIAIRYRQDSWNRKR